MEQKPSVILGKPMRKYKPSLITEEDVKFEPSETSEDKSPISPSKPTKTLLEESLDYKQSEAPVNQPESIGVDKRLLLSVLAAKKSESLIGCGWEPFSYVKSIPQAQMDKIRKARKIIVEGTNIPPLALKFKDMRIPDALCEYLENVKKISDPSLIQMQGIPVALSGRDLIGIASTGSGKTLSFCIPLLLFALESELKLPIAAGEGPVGIILAPSVRNF
jgi:ATP-dependent RNA helicase DDX41